jgi:hypothetical protein
MRNTAGYTRWDHKRYNINVETNIPYLALHRMECIWNMTAETWNIIEFNWETAYRLGLNIRALKTDIFLKAKTVAKYNMLAETFLV